MKQMWLYYYDKGFGAVIHLPGDITKVMVFEEKGRLPERLPSLEEIQQRLREMSGDESATLTDPVWLSHGELLTGVAPSLIDGRIILAGDACNPILPNGGQGLNTGIQDSLNLAWKLHDVIQGYAASRLLDTYDTERRANRVALERIQIDTLKYTLPAPKLNRFILGRFGNTLLNRFWPLMAKAFSQLGVNYEKSPLTLKDGRERGLPAGHRVLDADVLRAEDAQEVSLFKELCVPQWKMILFDGGKQLQDYSFLNNDNQPWIKKYMVMAAKNGSYQDPNCYYDIDCVAHQAYRIKKPTLLLIRPDNYVAALLPSDALADVNSYFSKWYPAIVQ